MAGLGLGALLASPPALTGGEIDVEALAAVRVLGVESQRAWLDGGFGRLTEGGEVPSDRRDLLRGQAQLGLDWRPAATWLVHVHGLLRYEGDEAGGERVGIPEAFAQFRPELTPRTALRLRAGLYFPPTSREATGPLWSSPYTLTLSALNGWLAEEVRFLGVDAALLRSDLGGGELQFAGGPVWGADSAGSLLAWRGFSFSDRLTVIDELLPLPPLPSLAEGGAFASQRDGTRPVDELDGRVGWHGRARWERPGRLLLQGAWTDTRGDRGLHRGQYAWRTRFGTAAVDLALGPVSLIAEAMMGDTGMGGREGPHVDARFKTAYLLGSWRIGPLRASARWDRFEIDERDGTAEPNDESGRALTVALLLEHGERWRLGVEYVDVAGDRQAAAWAGASPDADARRLQLELRLSL